MYHRIDQPLPNSSLAVSPVAFSRQMEWLEKRRFRLLSLDEVLDCGGRIPLLERGVALTFDDGFQDNYQNAFSILTRKGARAALFVVVNWAGTTGHLDWTRIRELSDAGITIGSHSLSHCWLPDIKDDEELKREVVDSKKEIEDKIGRSVDHFSYPVGGVDQRVADAVCEAGYRAAWVAGAKPSSKIRNPFFSLRRVKVSQGDSSMPLFSLKAYGIKGLFQ